MADQERMTIVLPAPLAAAVKAAVEAGEYTSASDVLSDAVRLWGERREIRARDLEVLRRAWDEGKASGIAGELDAATLIAEEKAQKARRS